MKTTARRDGDVYQLNGSKMWATLANECDAGILLAKTDPDAGAKGVTAFIVEPKKYPGFTARPIDMMGLSKSFRTAAVFLDDFMVPVENRLGEEGEGFTLIMKALESGRIMVGAKALGLALGCLEDAVRYANERTVRGGPIGRFQMIQSEIAEMVTSIEATRALIYDTARRMDAGLAVKQAVLHSQVSCLADSEVLRGQGAADLWRLRARRGIPDLAIPMLRGYLLHGRGFGQRAEDPDRGRCARLQEGRSSSRQGRSAGFREGRHWVSFASADRHLRLVGTCCAAVAARGERDDVLG